MNEEKADEENYFELLSYKIAVYICKYQKTQNTIYLRYLFPDLERYYRKDWLFE